MTAVVWSRYLRQSVDVPCWPAPCRLVVREAGCAPGCGPGAMVNLNMSRREYVAWPVDDACQARAPGKASPRGAARQRRCAVPLSYGPGLPYSATESSRSAAGLASRRTMATVRLTGALQGGWWPQCGLCQIGADTLPLTQVRIVTARHASRSLPWTAASSCRARAERRPGGFIDLIGLQTAP